MTDYEQKEVKARGWQLTGIFREDHRLGAPRPVALEFKKHLDVALATEPTNVVRRVSTEDGDVLYDATLQINPVDTFPRDGRYFLAVYAANQKDQPPVACIRWNSRMSWFEHGSFFRVYAEFVPGGIFSGWVEVPGIGQH